MRNIKCMKEILFWNMQLYFDNSKYSLVEGVQCPIEGLRELSAILFSRPSKPEDLGMY